MWTIASYAFRERIRKKEYFVMILIAVLIFLLYGSGNVSVMVNGETLSDFEISFVVLHEMLFGAACILAFVMSMATIPNEYDRGSSHLVWTRGISQKTYHAGLALSNILASLPALVFFYLLLCVYCVRNNHADYVLRAAVSVPVAAAAVITVSLFTSVLSIRLPRALTGFIGVLFLACGILHGVLQIYENVLMDASKRVLSVILRLVPDIHGIGVQARNLMAGEAFRPHVLWYGLLFAYLMTLCFVMVRKEHA